MPSTHELEHLWAAHDREWRDPALAVSPWQGAKLDARLLQTKSHGEWWETIGRLGITLLLTREYEHVLMALGVAGGRPVSSYLPLPHPSGLVIDREPGTALVASTRNPNLIYELAPARANAPERTDGDRRLLLPARSMILPGSLYLHDLAKIGGRLHANAVGQNAIVEIEPGGEPRQVWWPRAIEREGRPDFSRNWIQLNSIAAGKDLSSSYFSASSDTISARRPGHRNFPVDRRGVIFSGATREPIVRGLTRPHSARLNDGRLWVDNSGYGELAVVEDGGFEVVASLPGWTRGLCFCEDVAFVGTSRVIPRFAAYAPGLDVERSRCGLHAIDYRSGRLLGSLTWPHGNQIFAVDWLTGPEPVTLPFVGSPRVARARAARAFYSFENPRERMTV